MTNQNFSLFIHGLLEIKSTAKKAEDLAQRLINSTTNTQLSKLLETYFYQFRYQIRKLDEYLNEKGFEVKDQKNHLMMGLYDELLSYRGYQGPLEIRDIVVITILEKLKKYQEASFQTLEFQAQKLSLDEELDLISALAQKITEEKQDPINIAKSLLHENRHEEYKTIGSQIFINLIDRQLKDEMALNTFMTQLYENPEVSVPKDLQNRIQEKKSLIKESLQSLLKLHSATATTELPSLFRGLMRQIEDTLFQIEIPIQKDIIYLLGLRKYQALRIGEDQILMILLKGLKEKEAEELLLHALQEEEAIQADITETIEEPLFAEGFTNRLYKPKK